VLRLPFACVLLLGLACGGAPRAEQHLQNELSFLVPYVDLAAEERAVRAAFAQRRLMVDERLQGSGYVALSATSLDRGKSAVRVITRRGVVVGEDGDAEDWFALARVALLPRLSPAESKQPLVGLLKTARGRGDGCVALYQLSPDGRALPVDIQVQRFGSLACIAELRALDDERFVAQIGWPELATLGSPRLELDLARVTPRLGQAPDSTPPALRVIEDGDWLDREGIRAARALPPNAPFSARHAQGVVRAALALATGRSTDQQLAAYGATLGRIPTGSPEAEVVAATTGHIERGWSEAEPAAPAEGQPDAPSEPPDPDAIVIEPEPS
jgi:hypothetical protein